MASLLIHGVSKDCRRISAWSNGISSDTFTDGVTVRSVINIKMKTHIECWHGPDIGAMSGDPVV